MEWNNEIILCKKCLKKKTTFLVMNFYTAKMF